MIGGKKKVWAARTGRSGTRRGRPSQNAKETWGRTGNKEKFSRAKLEASHKRKNVTAGPSQGGMRMGGAGEVSGDSKMKQGGC